MSKPMLIDQPNLSLAWAEAFQAIRTAPSHRLSPLTLSFTGFENNEPVEDQGIRETLDEALKGAGKIDKGGMQSVQTVANTIFPQVLWRRAKGDRHALYASYRENLPDYVTMCPQQNKRGLYFGRLTAFGLDHKTGEPLPRYPKGSLAEDGNQLEVIIKTCKKSAQTIKLQASVFDPTRDHIPDARVSFPCLQHVTFVPNFSDDTIVMNAFYATQQLFMKAYGNFLGLARLGLFVAGETNLNLDRVTCFIGVEKMEDGYKPPAGKLLDALVSACENALDGSAVAGGTR
jgi:hypothetical protein